MQPSPYRPGEVASEVPGRGVQLAEIEERITYMTDLQRFVGRIRVDHAPRGVGKTSLLREAQRRAEAQNALTLWVTAGEDSGLIPSIAREISRKTQGWRRPKALREKLDGFTVRVAAGVPGVATIETSWAPQESNGSAAQVPPETRDLEDLLVRTHDLAAKKGKTGLVLFVDEVQDADPAGLRVLAYAWQHFQSERPELPAAMFAAGLPSSPAVINAAVSPSERFAFKHLDNLDDAAAAVALTHPATTLQVTWEAEALDAAVAYAHGYPHSVQLVGSYAWQAAGHPDPGGSITPDHVSIAVQRSDEDLRQLFDARLGRINREFDLAFVQAMAALGDGPVKRADVAAQMNVDTQSISAVRDRLIKDGIVIQPRYGYLEFTLVGFAEHVRRHFGLDAPDQPHGEGFIPPSSRAGLRPPEPRPAGPEAARKHPIRRQDEPGEGRTEPPTIDR